MGTGHGQLEGCNRNLRPKAALAKVYTHSKGVVVPAVRLPACRVLVGPYKEVKIYVNYKQKNYSKFLC